MPDRLERSGRDALDLACPPRAAIACCAAELRGSVVAFRLKYDKTPDRPIPTKTDQPKGLIQDPSDRRGYRAREPDCSVRVTVDPDDKVLELNDQNNVAGLTTPG